MQNDPAATHIVGIGIMGIYHYRKKMTGLPHLYRILLTIIENLHILYTYKRQATEDNVLLH